MNRILSAVLLCITSVAAGQGLNANLERLREIRSLMWDQAHADFRQTAIPEKWKDEPAVIIAKSRTLSYKGKALLSMVDYRNYRHYRIKLIKRSALEEYATFEISGGGHGLAVYAGFKIIKNDGREKEVSLGLTVKETITINNRKGEIYKLAIPNLEPGDILDYFLAYELSIPVLGNFHSFDPVVLNLTDDYPVVKQWISLAVLRRCYINLKTFNGAPAFKPASDENDENQFLLEDGDREGVRSIRWLYPNRLLPYVKFKVTYATTSTASSSPMFLGEPGKIKSTVGTNEIRDLMARYFGFAAKDGPIRRYMRDNFGTLTDPNDVARKAFYVERHLRIVDLWTQRYEYSGVRSFASSMLSLSEYYRKAGIPHDFMIGISRQISTLQDLLMEDDMTFMLKVNTSKPFYIGRMDRNATLGEIDPDLQGEKVFAHTGLVPPASWILSQVDIPILNASGNLTESSLILSIKSATEGTGTVAVHKSFSGSAKWWPQNTLMDSYDFRNEEDTQFKPEPGQYEAKNKDVQAAGEEYARTRIDSMTSRMKRSLQRGFGFTLLEISDRKIVQSGRHDGAPEFAISCSASVNDFLRPAGGNYLLEVGKFTGKTSLRAEEKERAFDAYLPYTQTFRTVLTINVPDGYEASGLEKLKSHLDNDMGTFTADARLDGSNVVVTATTIHKTNFVPRESWPQMFAILQAVDDYTKAQLLLVRK